MMTIVKINTISIGNHHPLVFILGPCVIESRDHCMRMAERLKSLSESQKFPFIFKSSFDKANRTSVDSFRGPGLEKGLKILQEVKAQFQIPVLTDIHEPSHAKPAAEVVDVLQIPAFLCRQTDLLVAAGQTGKPVNIKKGQFVSPFDIIHPIRKVESTGNHAILLTERGVSFGYGNLITDARSIPIMQETGYPVIFDATHSAQIPGGTVTGGNRKYIPTTAKAMVAAGCDGIFMEIHDNVNEAKSDRSTQFPLDEFPDLLRKLIELSTLVREKSY
ncbi:MAG: 3-deoxy-8-phosphooctulonate synthase [Candidatus Marinimicrobia bacterium CG08_land_8_20_14_0_20_45_22]|nr:MAG: 3-deoxy-8-phosphooctulonate synthase [Candidatus Marinimicrobia bacterium CG08_land_8_20_14_0_20_45_22]